MNSLINYYHRRPTSAELIQEAVTNLTETIKYPNIITTQLINTPHLTRFHDEDLLN